MPLVPSGTVTFLFTDIEGSTHLLQELGDERFAKVLSDHRRLLRDAFQKWHGRELESQGDGFLVAFSKATDAVMAAVEAQTSIATHQWSEETLLRIRVGIHTGEPVSLAEGYAGLDVHEAARICAAAHGGQILISQATRELIVDEFRDRLYLKDLGEHRLKDLRHPVRLFQIVAAELHSDFPPVRSLNVRLHNLPMQLTSFIGREREKAELIRLMTANRLLTLTGVGGSGKTRLALEVAAEVLEGFADGVWLIDFAPASEPDLVPQVVASALKVREQPGREIQEALADYLTNRRLLLLLDNCEHLLAACAALARGLLQSCPGVQVLATSREPLGVAGEIVWTVPPLSIPDVHRPLSKESFRKSESARLFVDRALAASRSFVLSDDNLADVAEICSRLDGIPLAIELAAARVPALTVHQISSRLNDAFRLLAGGSRTALPRHQTLRAVTDWSYDLLSESERILLRRLSVFAGGFTLDAAEAICPQSAGELDVLELLTALVHRSLVVTDEHGPAMRYRLLETVRQYAREKLLEAGEENDVRRRHADWYLELTTKGMRETRMSADRGRWLDRLEDEHDNLRAALGWYLQTGNAEAALRLADSLASFWAVRGHWTEGRRWLEASLSAGTGVSPALRASVLNWLGRFVSAQGDHHAARRQHEESLSLFRETGDKLAIAASLRFLGDDLANLRDYDGARGLYEQSLSIARDANSRLHTASSLNALGKLARAQGDYEKAGQLFHESLAIFREMGASGFIAGDLRQLGVIALRRGEYPAARSYYEEALKIHRDLGEKHRIARILTGLGHLSMDEGNYGAARAALEVSLALERGGEDQLGVAYSLIGLGRLARAERDCDRATSLLREGLELARRLDDSRCVMLCLEIFGRVAFERGAPERAARLLGATAALQEATGEELFPSPLDRADHERVLSALRTRLPEDVFAAAWAEGRAMTLEQAIDDALSIGSDT